MSQLTRIADNIRAHKDNTPQLPNVNRFTYEPETEKNRTHLHSAILRNDDYEGTLFAYVEFTFAHLKDEYRADVHVHIADYRDYDTHKNHARLNYSVSSLKRITPGRVQIFEYNPQVRDALRKSLNTALDSILGIDTPADNYTRSIKLTKTEVIGMLVGRLTEKLERVTAPAHHYANAVNNTISRDLWDITRYRNGNVHGIDLTEQDIDRAMNRARANHKRELLARARSL